MQEFCSHPSTELVARRDGIDYVRCRDCGRVFEFDDLETTGIGMEEDQPVQPD
jgi:hypothetical protein